MLVYVRVDVLAQLCNPMKDPPWDDFPEITIAEIAEAIRAEAYKTARKNWHDHSRERDLDNFYNPDYDHNPEVERAIERAYHIARIAFLVTYGWSDHIAVDANYPAGAPSPLEVAIVDGNHRFCAAIYRGDALILAEIVGELENYPGLVHSYVNEISSEHARG